MRARKVKTARLGMLCCPKSLVDYAYVVASIDREANSLSCMILWSPCSSGNFAPGNLWNEPLDKFVESLRDGSIRRLA